MPRLSENFAEDAPRTPPQPRALPQSVSVPLLYTAELSSAPMLPKSPKTIRQKSVSDAPNGTSRKSTESTIPTDSAQLARDHRELSKLVLLHCCAAADHKPAGEKYQKVKRFYFEKEEQVKTLQNTLAHQRIAQSHTSLDDSEYTSRLNRLDGLIAQLAYSIRKSWTSLPPWLAAYINKDATQNGSKEMIAVGRAFICWWVQGEIFDRYFHPDIEPLLSEQLKTIQKTIRRVAPTPQTSDEEELLASKLITWRLATLDGLQDHLRSEHSAGRRPALIAKLQDSLMDALQSHLTDPPFSSTLR